MSVLGIALRQSGSSVDPPELLGGAELDGSELGGVELLGGDEDDGGSELLGGADDDGAELLGGVDDEGGVELLGGVEDDGGAELLGGADDDGGAELLGGVELGGSELGGVEDGALLDDESGIAIVSGIAQPIASCGVFGTIRHRRILSVSRLRSWDSTRRRKSAGSGMVTTPSR